jgi:hypothetical protein
MHRRRCGSSLTGLGLAAALLLAAPAARAGIISVATDVRMDAESATQGVFDTPPSVDEEIVSPFNKTLIAHTQGGEAKSSVQATLTQGAGFAALTASGSTDSQHCCRGDEPGTDARAGNHVGIEICTDERSSFSAHAQASVESPGHDSTDAFTHIVIDGEEVETHEAADETGLPRSITMARTGVIGGGSPGAPRAASPSVSTATRCSVPTSPRAAPPGRSLQGRDRAPEPGRRHEEETLTR